ncbi:MAG: DUF814 domain-containing protein [Bdellovibrionales bacterium]|nr:DUF814 domain-containing protein [Bdellovibrionales bacterium]
MFPVLNALEIARLAEGLARECIGAHVERLSIPERPDFPEGYLKSEWVLRLNQRKRDLSLFLSVRPRACYLALAEGKGPKHAPESTRSPFDQALSKHIKGARLTAVRAVERERILVLEFPGAWLILVFIPALPEALLVDSKTLQIIARSRTIREASKQVTHWSWPEAREIPAGLVVREEFFTTAFSYQKAIEQALREEAFGLRLERAERAVTDLKKALSKSIRQSEEAIRAADQEPDWALFGETLKAWLYALPEPTGSFWQLGDLRVPTGTGKKQEEGLEPRALLEKFFLLAKRKKRRREEAQVRLESAQARLAQVAKKIEVSPGDWGALARFEQLAGIAGGKNQDGKAGVDAVAGPKLKASVPAAWQGKVFISKDGFPILVGRSREENLELTFKIARGNDLWMHVRGKPGAHVLIPVPSGKSVPLDTLLDAAALCMVFSGGKDWGKTEVDYTFKKYVKRIKDSSEASYTNNKTLIATAEETRLSRLTR